MSTIDSLKTSFISFKARFIISILSPLISRAGCTLITEAIHTAAGGIRFLKKLNKESDESFHNGSVP